MYSGCEGGDPYDAYEYVVSPGVVSAACSPYTIPTCPPAQEPCLNFVPTPPCIEQCNNTQTWNQSIISFYNSSGVDSDPQAIMTEIYTNGPVEGIYCLMKCSLFSLLHCIF